MKPKTSMLIINFIILGISLVLITTFFISRKILYDSGHDYVEDDRTTDINVMLTRPEGWRKIQTANIMMSQNAFSKIDGSTATIPITAELSRQFCDVSDDDIRKYVDHNTTHNAYKNLIYTAAGYSPDGHYYSDKDLIFVTEPSEEELDIAKESGVELDIAPIALDGFVFITHKDNPIDSLTVKQVQDIYSGKITNWKELGGDDAEIIPYQRNSNSGSQTAMEQLVMQDVPLMKPKIGYEINGMGGLIEKVGEYQNHEGSIGYTYLYYINNLYKSENIKVLKIEGVYPDNENLLNGSYPFTSAYYEVKTKSSGKAANAIYNYLLTEEGQSIIELAGYCPVGAGGE